MIYYKVENDYIYKYSVEFDKELLKIILDYLIDNCSIKKHIIKKSTINPDFLISNPLGEKIDNIFIKNTGITIFCNDTNEYKMVYEYDYIHIIYPKLAIIIGRLLNDDDTVVYDIMNYKIEYLKNNNQDIVTTKKYYEQLISVLRFNQLDMIPISNVIAYKKFFSLDNNIIDFDIHNKKLIIKKDI